MTAQLVMMEGPPGAGKSTLAANTARSLGPRADLVTDASLFERAEFADVANAYRTRVWPTAEMLLSAYARVIDRARQEQQIVVADFSAVGLAEELPWAQPDRISVTTNVLDARADPDVLEAHARDVLTIAKTAVLFVLDVPVAVGVRRRHAQRGIAWLEGYARHALPVRRDESVVDRATRVFEAGMDRRNDIVRAHVSAGWTVVHLDATAPEEFVLERGLHVLR